MLKIGIVGLGFMGKMHFRCYKSLENVKISAICDVDAKRLKGSSGSSGNISCGSGSVFQLACVSIAYSVDLNIFKRIVATKVHLAHKTQTNNSNL